MSYTKQVMMRLLVVEPGRKHGQNRSRGGNDPMEEDDCAMYEVKVDRAKGGGGEVMDYVGG